MTGTVAVLLAAGGGSRFGGEGHKLLTPFRGAPLVAHALAAALGSGLRTIVVQGSLDLSGLAAPSVRLVDNPDWRQGQAASLQAGLEAAAEEDAEAVVVGLGDQPLVPAAAWAIVAAAEHPIAVATYGGRRGNPVRLARAVWPLLPTEGDEGARRLMRNRPGMVAAVACPGNPADVDTVEDLVRWS
ncbi:MAG: NTP transferase domain-containing protein [Actinomycetota bacterium]|nr:NTP transferase domain-containing protein [Actinomycetota bacterium]